MSDESKKLRPAEKVVQSILGNYWWDNPDNVAMARSKSHIIQADRLAVAELVREVIAHATDGLHPPEDYGAKDVSAFIRTLDLDKLLSQA